MTSHGVRTPYDEGLDTIHRSRLKTTPTSHAPAPSIVVARERSFARERPSSRSRDDDDGWVG